MDGSANRDRAGAGRVGPPHPLEQHPGCPDRRRRVAGARDPRKNRPIASSPTNLSSDPVVAQDRPRRQPVEAVEERPELGRAHALADARGASDVGEQQAHRDLGAVHADLVEIADAVAADRRVAGKRPNPMCRSTAPPGPSNGAAHSLQFGPCGRCRITARKRAKPGSSPVRKPRIASSGLDGRGIAGIPSYARRKPRSLREPTRGRGASRRYGVGQDTPRVRGPERIQGCLDGPHDPHRVLATLAHEPVASCDVDPCSPVTLPPRSMAVW